MLSPHAEKWGTWSPQAEKWGTWSPRPPPIDAHAASYVCLNHRHGLWRTIVTFAIKTCFKTFLPHVNLLQITLYNEQSVIFIP